MNRRLALEVFIIDKETSSKWIIKNKALVPWRALGILFLIIHLPSVFIYYIKPMFSRHITVFYLHMIISTTGQWWGDRILPKQGWMTYFIKISMGPFPINQI